MRATRRLRGAAAIVGAGLLVAAVGQPGCATPTEERQESVVDLRAYLRDGVDAERSTKALSILDEIERQAKELVELRTTFQRDLVRLNADQAATDDMIVQLASRFREARARTCASAIASRTAMRDALSPEEWAGYAERDAKLFAAVGRKGGDK